jgi:hypothetical protein
MMKKLPALAFVILAASCVSVRDEPLAHGRVILYTTFTSGGDAPLVDSLAVFEDGFARYHLVGRSPRWIKIGVSQQREAESLRDELRPIVPIQPMQRVCCDDPELFVDLEKRPDSMAEIEPKQLIVYPSRSSSSLPLPVQHLIAWRNRLAHSVGGRYWLRVP